MTSKSDSERSNENLAWFFTDPSSRYELAELVQITLCSRDDIQNWVRRGTIEPDEATPGRRIYLPTTVMTLATTELLRGQGVAVAHAVILAHILTKVALDWFADGRRKPDEMPKFNKDFRDHYAVYRMAPKPEDEQSASGTQFWPYVFDVGILHRSKLDQAFDRMSVGILRLPELWLHVAEAAKDVKCRPLRRMQREDGEGQ